MSLRNAVRSIVKSEAVSHVRSYKRRAELALLLKSWDLSVVDVIADNLQSANIYKVKLEDGTLGVLKHFKGTEERLSEAGSAELLEYYGSEAAVDVLRYNRHAILLEHIDGEDLTPHLTAGRLEEAIDIVCDLIKELHEVRPQSFPKALKPLATHFPRLLGASKAANDSMVGEAREVLVDLLETTENPIPLHSDLHGENVMHSSNRDRWVIIDPRPYVGDKCFDVATAYMFQRDSTSNDIERITDLTGQFADRLGAEYSPSRIARFAFANHVNSSLWTGIPEAKREEHRAIASCFRKQF